jgi:hypothetical protein
MKKQNQLLIAIVVYLLYVTTIFLSNWLMKMSVTVHSENLEKISGMLFGFVAIPVFSLFIPIWLARKWQLDYSFWPRSKNVFLVIVVMAIFTFLVSEEAIRKLIESGLSFKTFSIHFLSTCLFHVTYYPLFVLLLFPIFRNSYGLVKGVLLTSFLFAMYHLCQFYFYPAGISLRIQLFLFCYFILSLILYLWSESLILTALVHQINGAISIASNGSIHTEMDFLYYLTIVIMIIFFGYMISQIIRNKDKMIFRSQWWLNVQIQN